MSSYFTCKHCGDKAISKCPNQRSIFPQRQIATLLGNMITTSAVRKGSVNEKWRREDDSNIWETTITIKSEYVRADNEADAIKDLVDLLLDVSKEELKVALCDHVWVIDSGECMFGCCKAAVAPVGA